MAYALSPNQVRLVWQPADTATASTRYEVERTVAGEARFQNVNAGVSATSFEDGSIPAGARTYTYRVRAVSASGQSAWVESNPVPVPAPCASDAAAASQIGCFGPVRTNWPLVNTFSALLPNGKVIGWYASDDDGKYRERTDVHNTSPRTNPAPGDEDGSFITIWNPANDTFQDASFGNRKSMGVTGESRGTDLFCAGYVVLSDGSFFTAGGGVGLEWGSIRTNIYDPRTNTWTKGPDTRAPDMWRDRWYPTLTRLPDGRILITGGTAQPDPGFVDGSPSTPDNPCRTPSGVCPPGLERGVPGGLSVGIGTQNANQTAHNNAFEIYDPLSGTLSMLNSNASAIASFEHYYPWWHIAPNGLAFLSGAGKQKAFLDIAQDRWSELWESTSYGIPNDAHRVYGSSVMYQPGRVLVIGGGYAWFDFPNNRVGASNNWNNGHTTIHMTLSNSSSTPPTMIQGPQMQFRRTHPNATLLADGRVFVNGGQQDGGESPPQPLDRNLWHNTVNPGTVWNPDLAVFTSEIWTPGGNGGTFTLGPRAQRPRMYHSVAMLLPDATVLTVGGGGCGLCAGNFETGSDQLLYGSAFGRPDLINQKNHEIYYPAYLFGSSGSLAPRPIITGFSNTAASPDDYLTLTYNSQFNITWNHPDPARSIGKVTFVALGTPTHAFNQNQRFLTLDIAQRNGLSLTVRAPYDGQYNSPTPGGARNIAPPGFYMLFLVDDRGVPSVARILRIQ
jgi:hypothetical protein